MRIITAIMSALLLLVATPAFSAVTVSSIGGGNSQISITYIIPTSSSVDIQSDLCAGVGWTVTVTCTSEMVTLGQCNSGQLGNPVNNPETCLAALNRVVRDYLRNLRKAGEILEADNTHVKPVRQNNNSGDIQ